MPQGFSPLTGLPHHGPDGPCLDAVPPLKADRERLRAAIREYVKTRRPLPPFSIDELQEHSGAVLAATHADEKYRKFISVLISNEAWRDGVARVPFAQRLLLLPKCLRSQSHCEGTMDEIGLVCADCGRCPIYDLKTEAERLGYCVLVAEGSNVVMSLIKGRKIEAVVGVSCLGALEAIYPVIEAAAVPGIAIPLLFNGCANTAVDLDWVWDAILVSSADPPRLDLDALRAEVDGWFTAAALDAALGPADGQTDRLARAWLAKSGKRWRPFLAVCTFQAFREDPAEPLPEDVRRTALAVECFHKASLIHDDIEDEDALRYGEKTLHEEHGVPIALNVGDFLLGEGYRLIAESGLPADRRAEMLRAAARGHRELCVGQGSELCWARRPAPLSSDEVLDIFRRKTAPAFEVALRLGAICAGAADGVWDALHRYSEALGVAYQIRDDLKDWDGDGDPADLRAMRPSILLAIAYERARGEDRRLLETVWQRALTPAAAADVRRLLETCGVKQEARAILASYKDEALRCLGPLPSTALKSLLRRVIFKMFHVSERGPLGESAVGHASGGAAGAGPAR